MSESSVNVNLSTSLSSNSLCEARTRNHPKIVCWDRGYLENNYNDDYNKLIGIFPEEIWYRIFGNAFHRGCFDSAEFENLRNASLVFADLLHPYREKYMFHNVLQVLSFRYPYLNEEIHEYKWQVPDFLEIRRSAQALVKHQFIIDTNQASSCPSKWQIGFKLFGNTLSYKSMGVFCKLLETSNSQKAVLARIMIHGASFEGYLCFFRPVFDKKFLVNETIDMPFCGWKTKNQMGMGHRQSALTDGTACYQIKLSTYNPFMW